MILFLQYALPLTFIILGWRIKTSKDPRWNSSRQMGWLLIVLGILTFSGRIILDYLKNIN